MVRRRARPVFPAAGRRERLPPDALGVAPAVVPSWAKPNGPTQAVFAAVSLVEKPRGGPIEPIAETAHAAGVPLTYLLGWDWIPGNIPVVDAEHARGDDVQVVPPNVPLAHAAGRGSTLAVSVLGAGMERRTDLTLAAKLGAFWGDHLGFGRRRRRVRSRNAVGNMLRRSAFVQSAHHRTVTATSPESNGRHEI